MPSTNLSPQRSAKKLKGGQVSRADVADFVLKQLTDDRYLRESIYLG